MRNRLLTVVAVLLVPVGAAAQNQETGGTALPGFTNQIDFGIRGTFFADGSDAARFQRYQDFRDGGTIDRFRFGKTTDRYVLKLEGDHVGYRDQRFAAAYHNYGNLKATFEWNQIPLFYSESTSSLYSATSPGVLSISDAVQTALQNRTTTLVSAVGGATAFDLRSRRDVANFNLVYSARPDLDLTILVRNTDRQGAQPWAGSFGIGGTPATVELAVPIDHRTTARGRSLEFGNSRGFARLAYEGSFFRNNVTTLTWDNPIRVTDAPAANNSSAPAFGRESLWPNSNMNAAIAAGGVNFAGRSR